MATPPPIRRPPLVPPDRKELPQRPIFSRRQQLCAAVVVGVVVAGAAMLVLAALAGTLWSAEPTQPAALTPLPSAADRARAEKDAADIFGGEVEAARKPADKAAVAAKMLATARKLDDDPAGRYVLAIQARDLAVAGGESKVAVRAAEVLAGYQPSVVSPPPSAKDQAARAHALWSESEKLRGQEQLAKQVEAAEWYLRAIGGLEGLDQKLVEKRLRELGWKGWPIDFRFDGKDTEGWFAVQHVAGLGAENGLLKGRFNGNDPFLIHSGVRIDGAGCRVVEIRMAADSGDHAELFWSVGRPARWIMGWKTVFPVEADGKFHVYRIDVSKHATWTGNVIDAIRLDPAQWHNLRPLSGGFSIDYIRAVR